MKKNITNIIAVFMVSISFLTAQIQQVNFEQVPGAFTTEQVSLAAGDYQFNISNNGVDHEVGFVLVPKGKYDPSNHIKAAYVTTPVATGKTSPTNIVTLAAGEYEYFCPLNPTDKYSLTVHSNVETLKFSQVPGKFEAEGKIVADGTYQFEVANNGVDHEVGFVLVPKGKYEATDHIKAAYVQAPVANGTSSMTGIVTLVAGEYEYFCPLNPTDKYSLTVLEGVETLKFTQVPGAFEDQKMSKTIEKGTYQFEIANNGVDHEVGFVLVPKGQYDPSNHIKAAYVQAPVANGTHSKTGIIELKAGEYEYFCPLNPTPKYNLTVR